nr:hypothetical protein [Tanacetum cinerariifolium]
MAGSCNSFIAWEILTQIITSVTRNYSSTEQVNSIQQLLTYCLITRTKVDIEEIIYSDLATKLLNKSRHKYVSYPRFIACALQVLLGCDYTQDVKFRLPGILSNFNFTKDSSKVPYIELTVHMIVVNNQKDLVSPLPFAGKKGTTTDPKDSGGNVQPADKGFPSTASNEGTAKTILRLEGTLGDKDSEGNKPPADIEPINPTVVNLSGIGANEKFKKSHGAEHQVLKREHSQKTKRAMELRMKRVTKLDELGLIIQKKKNIIVKDLMTSLGKRYERMMIILKELRIQSALPALVPEQAPSESLWMKKKHIELEPKIKVPGLECNKSLPEGVPFINSMVNEEHEYGIFFSDVFGDQAFQR